MESVKFVGRVGGLAVALGIGAAMAGGSGVAWAGPTGSEGDTSQEGASAAEGESDSGRQHKGGAESGSTGLKGPLSRIGEQVRKTLESSANSVIKRANRASEGVFDNRAAADDAIGPRRADYPNQDQADATARNVGRRRAGDRR